MKTNNVNDHFIAIFDKQIMSMIILLQFLIKYGTLFLMNWSIKNIFINILTISYSFIGLARHYPSLDEVTDYFFINKQFFSETKSNPKSDRPIWTKKKHFPPNSQTKVYPHVTPFKTNFSGNNQNFFIIESSRVFITSFLITPSAKPRDPPIA
jgi:hypothetical protein